MKKFKFIILPIMLVFLLALSINVSALSLTNHKPVNNDVISGSYPVQVTNTTEVLNVTWFMKCTNTNTTYVQVAQNVTATGSNWSSLIDTTQFHDDVSCSIQARANLSTTDVVTVTGLTIDNTASTAATGLETGTQDEESWTLSVGINSKNTQSCTIEFENGGWVNNGASLTYSNTANTCSQTYTLAPGGDYKYRVATSDGTNVTRTAYTALQIDNLAKGHTASNIFAQQKANGNQNSSPLGVIFFIGVIAYFMLKK